VISALAQRVCSSASPVDLLRALPASRAAAISTDDATSPPPTSTRTLMLSPCCRTRDIQRRWNTHVATVPVASDVTCTCAGWMSGKPNQYSSPTPFPAPPPVPRRWRTTPPDRRRRIDDAYSTYTSDNVDVTDVELTASLPIRRHLDRFRLCCFRSTRSLEPEQKTTGTTELVGLTTVCRCSTIADTGNGNRNSRHDEHNSKHMRDRRRHRMLHVLIACIVALPLTGLALFGLFLMLSPLYHSTTGKFHHLVHRFEPIRLILLPH